MKKIELIVDDRDNTIENMLEYIGKMTRIGHGFDVDVDIDDKQHHKHYYIDGDGRDKILSMISFECNQKGK